MRRLPAPWLIALGGLCAAGCHEDRRRAEEEQTAAKIAAKAAADPDLQDPLGRVVMQTAASAAPGYEKIERLFRGELAPRERRSFLVVLPYGHCYRFVAAGGAGVRDLDLALFDPNGVETQRDVTDDATPVLGGQASICPIEAGAYRVEARMRAGEGGFAIGLYRDVR